MVNTIVLNFQGKSTENEVYQVILSNLNEMIISVGERADLLAALRIELKGAVALVENRHYRATHPQIDVRPSPLKEPIQIF